MSKQRQDLKACLDIPPKKCAICDTYQTKIDDVEQSLSGRDQIIFILQSRLKQCETNYKNLFDEFEKLRFDHCTALQDNYSLKTINSKLEEHDLKTNKSNNDQKCICCHSNQNLNNNVDNKRACHEAKNPVIKEINNIENLVCNQNQILKQLLDKIIKELKGCHCDNNPDIFDNIHDKFPHIECGGRMNVDPKVKELAKQVESLKSLLNQCQEENAFMKTQLEDKNKDCSEYQTILQDTSKSVNTISINREDVAKDKTTQKQPKETSCSIQESTSVSTSTMNEDDEMFKNKIVELKSEIEEKKKEYDAGKCQMLGQMQDISHNNQILSDTLEVMKAENRNNLETVETLKQELRKVNEECENKQQKIKSKFIELEYELEESRMKEKKLQESLENSMEEIKQLKNKLKIVQENSTVKICTCEEDSESNCKLKEQIADLEYACGEMKKDITEKALELSEYEDENKALHQKIESLTKSRDGLMERIQELEEQSFSETKTNESKEEGQCRANCRKKREIESLKNTVKIQAEEIEQLRNFNKREVMDHLQNEGRCLGDGCILGQQQKLQEIESLKEEIEQLKRAKEDSSNMNQTKGEYKCSPNCAKKKEGLKNTIKIQAEKIEELRNFNKREMMDHLLSEGRCLGDDCILGQQQKLQEIEDLKETVRIQAEEIEQLKNGKQGMMEDPSNISQTKGEYKCSPNCVKKKETLQNTIKIQAEEIEQLRNFNKREMMDHLLSEGRCLGDDCILGQQQKLQEIEDLKETVRIQAEEIEQLKNGKQGIMEDLSNMNQTKGEYKCSNGCTKKKEDLKNTIKIQAEEIEQLTNFNKKEMMDHLLSEGRCLGGDCILGQQQKLQEIESLKEEIEQLKRDKEDPLNMNQTKGEYKCSPNCDRRKEALKNTIKIQAEEIEQLRNFNKKEMMDHILSEGRCLGDDCILGQQQKLQEIESLRETVRIQAEEIEQLKNDKQGMMEDPSIMNQKKEEYKCSPSCVKKNEVLKNTIKIQAEEIEQLRNFNKREMMDHLLSEGRCLGDDCILGQQQKLQEIKDLKETVRIQGEEIEQLKNDKQGMMEDPSNMDQKKGEYKCSPNCVKRKEALINTIKLQAEEIEQLRNFNKREVMEHLLKEGRCLGNDCILGQQQKLSKIESLQNIINIQNGEIDKLKEIIQSNRNSKCGPNCGKLLEIESLKDTVKIQAEEIERKNKEIAILRYQRSDNKTESQEEPSCYNVQEDSNVKQLERRISSLHEQHRSLDGPQQKLLESLKNTVKIQAKEIEQLKQEKQSKKVEKCGGPNCGKLQEVAALKDTIKLQAEQIDRLNRGNDNYQRNDNLETHEKKGLSAPNLPKTKKEPSCCAKDNSSMNEVGRRISSLHEQRLSLDDRALVLQQKLWEIESLKYTVKIQAEEIERKEKEIAILRYQRSDNKIEIQEKSTCSNDGENSDLKQLGKRISPLQGQRRSLGDDIEQLKNDKKELMEKIVGDRPCYQEREIESHKLNTSGLFKAKNEDTRRLYDPELMMKEIERLTDENADLKSQIERQQRANKRETEKLQSTVNNSQRQVELLLKEHDEKTAQIQNVAAELDIIRRSVNQENSDFYAKITQLERERDQLKSKLEDAERNIRSYDGNRSTSYDGNKPTHNGKRSKNGFTPKELEIETLKAEISKKQLVILELEKTVDNFNHNIKQIERNLDSLRSENSSLKDENEKQHKDLENIRKKLAEKVSEVEIIQNELQKFQHLCEKYSDKNNYLEKENANLKNDMDKITRENERVRRVLETEKLEFQMELERLKEEYSMRFDSVSNKLDTAQKAQEDVRSQFSIKGFENEKLREELQNARRLSQELKQKAQALEVNNDKLRIQNRAPVEEQYKMGQKLSGLQDSYEKMTRQYTTKSLENDELQAKITELKKEGDKKDTKFDTLQKKFDKEIANITDKYNELQKELDQKCEELKKVKRQSESFTKQSQISREEYNNLRKEYKEIKVMLADQIKRYKQNTNSLEADSDIQKDGKIVENLKLQLQEKDNQIMALQKKIKDCSYEVIELKDHIQKLISDNNILKSAINNLICNLERKIKGSYVKNPATDSADAIAGEILQSLTSIESSIIQKSQNRYCPAGCTGEECDCMSQIQSQYKKESKGTRTAGECSASGTSTCKSARVRSKSGCNDYTLQAPPRHFCGPRLDTIPVADVKSESKRVTDTRLNRTAKEELVPFSRTYSLDMERSIEQGPSATHSVDYTPSFYTESGRKIDKESSSRISAGKKLSARSQPSTSKNAASDISTTEYSDEGLSGTNFLDPNSVEALKESLQELKTSQDSVTKENGCCD